MIGRDRQLRRILGRRLTSAGIDPARFLAEANEIIVFGSRAVGVESRDSDLDVLVVGGADRLKAHGLDVIPIAADRLKTREWLGSELAAHVATYGVWLSGPDSWRSHARIGTFAITKKQRRLGSLVAAVARSWGSLHPSFRFRHATTIRRELQRFALLNDRQPIPPTRFLDEYANSNSILATVESLDLASHMPRGLLASIQIVTRGSQRRRARILDNELGSHGPVSRREGPGIA